jgi:molybdopterin synthase catalytic subunit
VFELSIEALVVERVIAAVAHPAAGAIDVFVGVVRDHNDGRAVTRLDYEAYATMAVAEMRRCAEEIAATMPGVRLAAVHRVGSLAVGDVAVVCAASAVHRGEAFRACKALIDAIKARAPIWKREHGPDGPYWVGWVDARCQDHHAEHGPGGEH